MLSSVRTMDTGREPGLSLCVILAMLALACGFTGPVRAQTPGARQQTHVFDQSNNLHTAIEERRRQSLEDDERRLQRRDTAARRALDSMCSGCGYSGAQRSKSLGSNAR